ncbi:MAG: type II secretion system protein GspL [bacterium]
MLYLQQSLGIDFRDRILRIVHLGRTLKGIVLVDYFIRKYPPLPPGSGKGEAEGDVDPLSVDLQNFIRERKIKQEQIVIGIPKEKVTLKEIVLPKVEEKQFQEMLEYEVERHIPFAVQGIAYDYQVLSKEGELVKVLLGIVKKDDLQRVLNLLDIEETKPVVMDVTAIAGTSWLISQNNLGDNKITAIVDIGESKVELVILAGKEIKATRSFNRTQNRLEDAYITEMVRPLERARSDQPNPAQSRIESEPFTPPPSWEEEEDGEAGGIPSVFQAVVQEGMEEDNAPVYEPINENICSLGQDIIRELDIAMNVFSGFEEEKNLDELILTGTEAYSGFLPEYIEAQTGVQVRILNPLRNITTKSIPGKIASSLSMAAGLALRGLEDQPLMLNFLAEGKKVKRKVNHLVVTATFMVLIVVLSLAWVLGMRYENGLISLELSKRLKALQPDVTIVKNISQEVEDVDKELSTISNIIETEISKMEILKELTTILPADTWLDNLSASNEKVEIDGYSESPSNLISMLEISPLLENVQFASSITKMGPGKERFKIKADIERKKPLTEPEEDKDSGKGKHPGSRKTAGKGNRDKDQ